jgi:sugar diacid utilization regulator
MIMLDMESRRSENSAAHRGVDLLATQRAIIVRIKEHEARTEPTSHEAIAVQRSEADDKVNKVDRRVFQMTTITSSILWAYCSERRGRNGLRPT